MKQVAVFAVPGVIINRAYQRELEFHAIASNCRVQSYKVIFDTSKDGDLIPAMALFESHISALQRRMPNLEALILVAPIVRCLKIFSQMLLGWVSQYFLRQAL